MPSVYELGPFRLDVRARVLTKQGAAQTLGARAIAVLTVLVAHAHEHVPKATLLDKAWPGMVVEEGNLSVQVAAIRRVLAQAPGGEDWVETLARRGYRFVGPVTPVEEEPPRALHDDARRSNLPEPLTSFIGRERELVELKRLLGACRLVTVTGTGGIGKTRLALQAAAEALAAYRDGVWFIDLAPISEPLLVASAVAQVLNVTQAAGRALDEALGAHLRGRQVLLVLDNCEHLLEASGRLCEALLRAAAPVTILATSREALHVTGEQSYPLSPLSLPEASPSAESAVSSEAVQLFLERARRHEPRFELTPARAQVVAELCVHLDGIPLALELAAARMPALSIEQIVARLDDRFRLLTKGARTGLPRQQTLRNALDWSHDLLTDDERILLRRLAVFRGSFELEAAVAVGTAPASDTFATLEILDALVARSMIIADTSAERPRYRLLETTRAYASEKLAEAHETAALQRRHAQYLEERFRAAHQESMLLTDAEWRTRYASDRDDVRAALDWASRQDGDPAIAVALAGCSGHLWAMLALFAEARQRLELAAARIGPGVLESDQARLWLMLGILTTDAMAAQAVERIEKAIAIYRRLAEPLELGYALVYVARALALTGRCQEALDALAEAHPIVERCGIARARGVYMTNSGLVKAIVGDFLGARRDYEAAVNIHRSTSAMYSEITALQNLSDVVWALGDLEAATTAMVELLARMRQSPMTRNTSLGFACCNLAGVLIERGENERALEAAREGLPPLRDAGHAWVFLDHLAHRLALVGEIADAARLAGYTDVAFASRGSKRQPNEDRVHARLHTVLNERLDHTTLHRLLAEGATLGDDEACQLALQLG